MELSDHDVQRIAEAVTANIKGQCLCGLSPEAAREMSHHMGMIKDVGSGDYSQGIEVFRALAKRFQKANRLVDYVGKAIASFLLISMLGGLIYIISEGAKQILRAIK